MNGLKLTCTTSQMIVFVQYPYPAAFLDNPCEFRSLLSPCIAQNEWRQHIPTILDRGTRIRDGKYLRHFDTSRTSGPSLARLTRHCMLRAFIQEERVNVRWLSSGSFLMWPIRLSYIVPNGRSRSRSAGNIHGDRGILVVDESSKGSRGRDGESGGIYLWSW